MISTPQLLALLQKKYGPPEYTFLTEVRNGTGFAKQPRTADALAFNLWPSRGMELYGFELKVSRQDWKHELAQPEKADAIANYCDRWWIIVGDEKVVQDPAAELPKTWGLQVATDKGLKVVREAPLNTNPKPLDRHFIWAVIRRFGSAPESAIKEAPRLEYQRGIKEGQRIGEKRIEELTRSREDANRLIQHFEQQSGLDIRGWRWGNASEVAEFLHTGGIDGLRRNLTNLKQISLDIAASIDAVFATAEQPITTAISEDSKGGEAVKT